MSQEKPKFDLADELRVAPCCQPGAAEPCCPAQQAPCCEQTPAPWMDGYVDTPAGEIPRASTSLTFTDTLGAWKARWGIGRMNYRVEPGLYAIGSPTSDSHVFVTANYKMSFDSLRRKLAGRDGWVLVLDTDAINVWCAAGKGTFGTDELVSRIESARLAEVVAHRQLILPQLGAPGVSAHEVKRRSRFAVKYGPVYAADLPAFLDTGLYADHQMRRVRFNLADRIVLTPVEIVYSFKYFLYAAAAMILLSGLSSSGYSLDLAISTGIGNAALLLAGFLGGTLLAPILLPWLPGRAFALKGACMGLALVGVLRLLGSTGGWVGDAAWTCITISLVSFLTMNFTGSTPHTSLSGVRKEMKIAVPLQLVGAIAGVGLWITGRFV